MKKGDQIKGCMIFLTLALTLSLGAATAAEAGWMENHGFAGHVLQSSDVIPWIGNYYSNGTLILEIKNPGKTAAVVFPVPTPFASGVVVDKIKFRFAVTNSDSVITQVDVYNGSEKVFTLDGPWTNTGGASAFKTVTVKLPAPASFNNGVGLDFKLRNNAVSGGRIFRFAMVGANFSD